MDQSWRCSDGDLERDLPAFADDGDRGRAADGGIGGELHEMVRVGHRLAVEGNDDVARIEPCLIRGRAAIDRSMNAPVVSRTPSCAATCVVSG